MKIDKDKQLQPLQNVLVSSFAKSTTDASQAAAQGSADTVDKVELSSSKGEAARLMEKTKAIPAVDEEKVAGVKQAIESGTYNVNSKVVARNILKSQLSDEIS